MRNSIAVVASTAVPVETARSHLLYSLRTCYLQGSATLVMGWASGRFGFLGIHTQAVANEGMNISGLLMCVASMGMMFFVKSVRVEQEEAAAVAGGKQRLLDEATLSDDSDRAKELRLR